MTPGTCAWLEVDCPQAPRESGYCYYHEKLKAGLTSSVDEYLNQTEVDTLFGGRRRSDGRRLDQYTKH